MALSVVAAICSVLGPSSVEAALHNPMPADASGDPSDSFTDADALFANVTSDLAGGIADGRGGTATGTVTVTVQAPGDTLREITAADPQSCSPFNVGLAFDGTNLLVSCVGSGVIDGNGEQAWAAALFFRDAVNAVVKDGGVNSLTRANFLQAAGEIHSFDADGMLATSDIPAKTATPCTSLFQVKGGKFVRVFPKKPATFDCNPKNVVTVQQPDG